MLTFLFYRGKIDQIVVHRSTRKLYFFAPWSIGVKTKNIDIVRQNGEPGNGGGSEVPPSVLKKKRTYTSAVRSPGRKENEKRSSHSVSFNLDTSDD